MTFIINIILIVSPTINLFHNYYNHLTYIFFENSLKFDGALLISAQKSNTKEEDNINENNRINLVEE